MLSIKNLTRISVIFLITTTVIYSCGTKEPEPTTKNNTTTPGNTKKDYLKINNFTFSPANIKVTAGFKGITRKTELKIFAGTASSPMDTFLSVEHDTVLIDLPCQSGMGETFDDSTVYFYGRLTSILGAPIFSTEWSNKRYGSYVVKMENGKRVSYFSGIDLVDDETGKRYICEGRITWP